MLIFNNVQINKPTFMQRRDVLLNTVMEFETIQLPDSLRIQIVFACEWTIYGKRNSCIPAYFRTITTLKQPAIKLARMKNVRELA